MHTDAYEFILDTIGRKVHTFVRTYLHTDVRTASNTKISIATLNVFSVIGLHLSEAGIAIAVFCGTRAKFISVNEANIRTSSIECTHPKSSKVIPSGSLHAMPD